MVILVGDSEKGQQMNRSAKRLISVTTALVWQTADDLSNSSDFPTIYGS